VSINTKHHRTSKLVLAGDELFLNGQRTAYVPNARREADRVRAFLHAALTATGSPDLPAVLPARVPVRSVVVIVGWPAAATSPGSNACGSPRRTRATSPRTSSRRWRRPRTCARSCRLADLELRHRRHARVEDRIRAAKDTGLRNLPFHDMAHNRIWVAISALVQDLLAWCGRLALPPKAPATSPNGSACGSSPSPDASCTPPDAASCASTPPGPGPTRSSTRTPD
jgi:hypothetical protein